MKHFPAFKALFVKELNALIYSPALYAAVLVLYLGAALPFVGSGYWFSAGLSDFRSFFLNLPFLFCIVIPLLAMNSWADEKKHGTDRLLAAYPVDKRLLAAAKYAALLACFVGAATLTMVIPLSVIPLVYFDFFPFFLSYCAVLFFGAAFTAWSLALSNISAYTAVGFLLGFFTGIFFAASHVLAQVLPLPSFIVKILRYCSFTLHFESAARGIFDTRDFLFYILLIVAAQGLSVLLLYVQEENR
ncbi:ABC transporter permease [Treponema vincentii]|uniref:ABC transporter permease n=1 Tax=Treponema vincentii TaxID=69710 RepID=UPI003D8EBFA2